MTIDHIASYLMKECPVCTASLFRTMGVDVSIFYILRCLGRLAFPIFCFLLIQGFLHTGNRKKYGIGLFAFAVISEIPYDLWTEGNIWESQNIFLTLWLGFLGMSVVDFFRGDRFNQMLGLMMVTVLSIFAKGDYGLPGFLFIMLLYFFRNRNYMMIPASLLLPISWAASLACFPISCYDGSRGFVQGRVLKYAFYVYYPLHLVILYMINVCFL